MTPTTPQTAIISISEKELHEISAFVYQTYGIDLSKKKQLIEGRLSHTLKSRGLASFSAYFALIRADKSNEELQFFLNKITTNHSYFARENDHFDFMFQTALPYLESHRRGDLRIWSAGCSSGQEAYTMAIVIDQYFGSRKSSWDTTILATDISTDVLAKARQGIYSEDNLNYLPPQWLKQYFTKLPNGTYQVIERIRNEVVFKPSNLMEPFVYKKPFDIIFCRNVMIYFDNITTQNTIEKFYQATAPGGYFFIGHSESVNRNATRYRYLQPAIYQKDSDGREG